MSAPESYRRVAAFVREHPWAILPETLATIVEVVRLRVAGTPLSDADIRTRLVAQPARVEHPAAPAGIAVIPVFGVMGHRMGMMTEISGGTSTERVQAEVRKAAADPAIGAIALDIDSPGGSVFGVAELADTVFEARQQKPVVAIANARMASAAYWIGSQATELIVTPSGEVGSIGVLAIHEDVSRAAEEDGLKVTYITSRSAPRKTDGNPFEPLSDQARAMLQGRVDTYEDLFTAAIARGRKMPQRRIQGQFGAGLMIGAEEAVELGMADRVEPMETALARLATQLSDRRGGRSMTGQAAATPRVTVELLEPDQEGRCPEGYEKGEDGKCHLAKTDSQEPGDPKAIAAACVDAGFPEAAKELIGLPMSQVEAQLKERQRVKAAADAKAAEVRQLCAMATVPEIAGDLIAGDLKAALTRLKARLASTEIDTAQRGDGVDRSRPALNTTEIYRERNARPAMKGA